MRSSDTLQSEECEKIVHPVFVSIDTFGSPSRPATLFPIPVGVLLFRVGTIKLPNLPFALYSKQGSNLGRSDVSGQSLGSALSRVKSGGKHAWRQKRPRASRSAPRTNQDGSLSQRSCVRSVVLTKRKT